MKESLELVLSEARAAWRYRWQALGVAWLLCLVGWVIALARPSFYESRAQIYVDTSSILRPLLQGLAVSPNTENEDVVRRALLARPTLEKVAHKTGLSRRASTPEQAEAQLKQLAKDLVITGEARLNIFSISFSDRDPRMAQAVVQSLMDSFVEDALGASRTDTASAQRFLRDEVADYESRLSAAEQRLSEFKKKNVGLMPDQRGDYFQRLQSELATQQKAEADLAVAVRQRDELRRKISAGQQEGTAALPTPSDQQIQVATELDARIQSSRRQLDELLLKFTEKHPEVIALRNIIVDLEERRQRELGGVRRLGAVVGKDGVVAPDAVMQNLQIQLNDIDVEIAALQAKADESNRRVSTLRQLVTSTPEVEAELARLNRDYGVTRTEYEQLLQRLESAKISDHADQSQELKFKVLEPPRVPLRPVSSLRRVLIVFVLFASLLAGAGVAYLLSKLHPVFVSARGLAMRTALPVLGCISRFVSAEERARELAGRRAYVAVAAVLPVIGAITMVVGDSTSQLIRHALRIE